MCVYTFLRKNWREEKRREPSRCTLLLPLRYSITAVAGENRRRKESECNALWLKFVKRNRKALFSLKSVCVLCTHSHAHCSTHSAACMRTLIYNNMCMYYVSWDSDECSHWTGWMNRLICVFIVCVNHIRINSNIEKEKKRGRAHCESNRSVNGEQNEIARTKRKRREKEEKNSNSSNIEPTPTNGWFNGYIYEDG